jgi:hypothetical protein
LIGRQGVLVERHAVFAVEAEDAADHQAVVGVAGDDGGTGHAALQRGALDVEAQPSTGLLRAVALVAAALENRADVAEVVHGRRQRLRSYRGANRRADEGGGDDRHDSGRQAAIGRHIDGQCM